MHSSASQKNCSMRRNTVERSRGALRIEKGVCAHETKEQISDRYVFDLARDRLEYVLASWGESSKVYGRNIMNDIHQHVVNVRVHDAGDHEATGHVNLFRLRTGYRNDLLVHPNSEYPSTLDRDCFRMRIRLGCSEDVGIHEDCVGDIVLRLRRA